MEVQQVRDKKQWIAERKGAEQAIKRSYQCVLCNIRNV